MDLDMFAIFEELRATDDTLVTNHFLQQPSPPRGNLFDFENDQFIEKPSLIEVEDDEDMNEKGSSQSDSDIDWMLTNYDSDEDNSLVAEIDGIRKSSNPPVPKTKNEILLSELPLTKIDVNVKPEDSIEYSGQVASFVDNVIVVVAPKGSKPLDLGSIMCLEDRRIIGQIDDVFGPVIQPHYAVRPTAEILGLPPPSGTSLSSSNEAINKSSFAEMELEPQKPSAEAPTEKVLQGAATENFGIEKTETLDITKTETLDITKTETLDITKTETLDITTTETLDIAKMETLDITKTENILIENTVTEKTENWIEKTENLDIMTETLVKEKTENLLESTPNLIREKTEKLGRERLELEMRTSVSSEARISSISYAESMATKLRNSIVPNTPVYFFLKHASFANPLIEKGSDASNEYDEEPGEEDIEYSDDEKEAEAKRQRNFQRKQRMSRFDGHLPQDDFNRSKTPNQKKRRRRKPGRNNTVQENSVSQSPQIQANPQNQPKPPQPGPFYQSPGLPPFPADSSSRRGVVYD